jgi:hypothetical protein
MGVVENTIALLGMRLQGYNPEEKEGKSDGKSSCGSSGKSWSQAHTEHFRYETRSVEHQLSDLFALVHDNEAHDEVRDAFNRLDSQWNKLHGMVSMVEEEQENEDEDDQDWEKSILRFEI